jgi:hypothetical protein
MSQVSKTRLLPNELLAYVAAYSEQRMLPVLICASRAFRDVALPWLYYDPKITSVNQFRKFMVAVPDSRSRWIHKMDLSQIVHRWHYLSEKEITTFLMRYVAGAFITSNDTSCLLPNLSCVANDPEQLQTLIENDIHHDRLLDVAFFPSHLTSTDQASSSTTTATRTGELPWRSRLQQLDICWTSIRDLSLTRILCRCGTNLHELSLANCYLTDVAIFAVAQWCPQIRKLDLSGTEVADPGILALANSCQDLRWLSLYGCEMITDDAVIALRSGCPRLRWLDLTNCYGILFETSIFTTNGTENEHEEAIPANDIDAGWETEEEDEEKEDNDN